VLTSCRPDRELVRRLQAPVHGDFRRAQAVHAHQVTGREESWQAIPLSSSSSPESWCPAWLRRPG
jgi:hypothetical protein